MGIAGIVMFFALAAAPPTGVHTEPPCGGRGFSFVRCGLELVEPPALEEGHDQREWLGPELGAAFTDATQHGSPGAYGTAQSLAILGLHTSLVLAGGFGYQPTNAGVAFAEARTDLTSFDTIVFSRAGFPSGTPFAASVELGAAAAFARQFREDPRDDAHITLQCTLRSDMFPEPAVIEVSSLAPPSPSQFARVSRFVTLRTGVEYRLSRSQHASVSPFRVGFNQQTFCGGSINSRVSIRPSVPDVTIASRASVYYTACPADLDSSWFVDDADFLLFAAAYALGDCSDPSMPLGCPADLNYDGVVDAADFVLFLPGYDDGFCPLFGDIDFGPQ